MAKVITLGEIMMRLSPPGYERFVQAQSFDINYGGAEANVAVSLAQLGHDTVFVSKIPATPIGNAAVSTLQKFGVDTRHIARGGSRLGIYFLENGASVRPSSVVYDRADSAITKATPDEFDFDAIFRDATLFHVSGITPVLSNDTAALTLAALKKAKEHGVTVSFDLNYRAKLWTDGIAEKQQMLHEMMQYVDICFGNARDAAKCLGYTDGNLDLINGDYAVCVDEEHMTQVLDTYHLKYLITTLRKNNSASDNGWSGAICSRSGLYQGKIYDLHIVDRVGGGDSFAGGLIYGLNNYDCKQSALEFAVAASCLKHSILGDFNRVGVSDVEKLMCGDGTGRVQR